MLDLKTTNENTVEIICSPELESMIRVWFEIPILKGERWEQDGLVHFRFEVTTDQMADVKKMALRMIQKPEDDSNRLSRLN